MFRKKLWNEKTIYNCVDLPRIICTLPTKLFHQGNISCEENRGIKVPVFELGEFV